MGTENGDFNICGIVGLINHKQNGLSSADRDIFKRLLYIDVERGADSTGLFSVGNDGGCDVVKEASPSYHFLNNKDTEAVIDQAYKDATFLVGHNRKATQGKISDENAHPFAEGNIVLVHNGSLVNHRQLENVDVDSRAIAIALDKANNNVEEVFSNITGAYTCIWYDNNSKTLNLFRNKERPLFVYEDCNTTYFASEWLMLYYSVLKSGVKWESSKGFELPVHTHLTYKINSFGGAKKESTTKLDIREPASFPMDQVRQIGHKTGTGVVPTKEEGISLNTRKKLRNQFMNFLQKNKTGSVVSFIPEDYSGNEGNWVLLGAISGAPSHINGCMLVNNMSEESIIEMCMGTSPLTSTITGFICEHKKMLFQVNLSLNKPSVH